MIAYPVVRLDLLQKTLLDIFSAQLGITIIWGRSNGPRPARPFGRFDLTSGPTRRGIRHEHHMVTAESIYLIDVPVPTIGVEYLTRINGVPLRHTDTAGTEAGLRDAFIALVNADREPATAVSTGPAQFSLTESAPGSIIDIEVSPTMSASIDPGSVQTCVKSHRSRSEVGLRLQVFSDTIAISTGANDIMSRVPLILDLDGVLDDLRDQRITIRDIAGPTDISELEGGGALYESRSVMDFLANITSLYSEPSSELEFFEGSIMVGSKTVPVEITA